MIQAYVRVDAEGQYIQVSGHAKYAVRDDIVCAAVSSIAYTLYGYLENHRAELDYVNVTDQGTTFRIACRGDAALPAFEMAVIGLKQIEAKHPDNVRVIIELDKV